jgi:hypothetical protein
MTNKDPYAMNPEELLMTLETLVLSGKCTPANPSAYRRYQEVRSATLTCLKGGLL